MSEERDEPASENVTTNVVHEEIEYMSRMPADCGILAQRAEVLTV